VILQDHRRIPIYILRIKSASVGSLKRVTKRFLKLISNFIAVIKNFNFDFFNNETSKNVENHQRINKMYFFDIVDLQNYI
jgi:hypothetical protein